MMRNTAGLYCRVAGAIIFISLFIGCKSHNLNSLNTVPEFESMTDGSGSTDQYGIPSFESLINQIDDNDQENSDSGKIPNQSNETSVDVALETAPGVDPNDPEEIARINYYKENMDVYQHILDINQHLHMANQMYEGDIKRSMFRNAGGRTWPKTTRGSKRGLAEIPFTWSNDYTKSEKATIQSAFDTFSKFTCIRFVPKTNQRSYIHVHDAKGCWAYVGRTGISKQTVSLGRQGCISRGIAMHELMHTLGFQHEQSRDDRDKYVKINSNNLEGGWNANFDKMTRSNNLVVYDYGSVMHYGKYAFSKYPYIPAMEVYPKRSIMPDIGQRERLSPYDIEEIRYLYKCGPGTYQRCGRDIKNQRAGSFKSPSHPKPYPAESHCTWSITVRNGKFIQIDFTNINIKDSPLCQRDAILIHDGVNAGAPLLRRICGTKSKVTVKSTTNKLFVIFSSYIEKSAFTGFRASFKEVTSRGTRPSVFPPTPTIKPITRTVQSFYCDFDNGMCGLTQDTNDNTNFILYSGRTPTRKTGPSGDYPSGTGKYIYTESSLPAKLGDTAVIRTPWFRRGTFCVTFSYHMYGQYMGGLRLYAFMKRRNSNQGKTKVLWQKYGDQKNKWHTAQATFNPESNTEYVQFYLEGIVYYYLSDMAIDVWRVDSGKCTGIKNLKPVVSAPQATSPPRPPVAPTFAPPARPSATLSRFSCNFDVNTCGFIQPKSDDFDWDRNSGNTKSGNTGPSNDNTMKNSRGYYMYIEASRPRQENHIAKLVTPNLRQGSYCVRFAYNMFGAHIGNIKVFTLDSKPSPTLRWEKSGNQGITWHQVSLQVSSSTTFQVMFQGQVGGGYSGDAAIDDVIIEPGSCSSPTINVVTTTTFAPPPPPTTTTVSSNSKLFSCDFESSGFCQMTQDTSDDFNWQRRSGSTPSAETGPTKDHTISRNQQGNYMYVEASGLNRRGQSANILTPSVPANSNKHCVMFWYNMYGNDGMGSLVVHVDYILRLRQGGRPIPFSTKIFEKSGNLGQAWRLARIEIGSTAFKTQGTLKVRFTGNIGTTTKSDIAVDDICVAEGPCGSSSPCSIRGVNKLIVRKPTTTTRRPTTTTRRPTTTARPTPPSNELAGPPLCTFEDKSQNQRNPIAVNAIPGPSTNDLGEYVYPSKMANSPMCGLIQIKKADKFDWTRNRGVTPSITTGPFGDKTTGRGHYMYMEASGRKPGDLAILRTIQMRPGRYCVNYYYHMRGNHLGQLQVKAVERYSSGPKRLPVIRTIAGNQEDKWINDKIDYTSPRTAQNVVFRFEGTVGRTSSSDIAIDDVAFMPGKCDACNNPDQQYVRSSVTQRFVTGCMGDDLFWVRCCNSTEPKYVYRRVRQCRKNMFVSIRLNWYCQNL